jgi:hypothetical protein
MTNTKPKPESKDAPEGDLIHQLLSRAAQAGAEAAIARLLPHLAKAGGDELITAKNYEAHFPSKNWRALQAFCERNGLTKLRLGGSPAYRRVDIEAALAKTAKTPEHAPEKAKEESHEAAYARILRAVK